MIGNGLAAQACDLVSCRYGLAMSLARVPFACLLILQVGGAPLRAADTKAAYQAPGTKRMAELLQKWDREFGEQNPYANFAGVKRLRRELTTVTNEEQRVAMQFELATELLNVGKPDEAVATVSNSFREMRLTGFRLGPGDRRQFRLLEGLANLRFGEVLNCVQHHNSESCLLPISPAARHVDPRGAQAAEAIFLEMARQKTNDLGARWLLNIAAMTLGHYPDGVPADVRIPSKVFESEAPFPKFKEIAAAIGIQINEGSGGTVVEDFDGDGLLDIMLSNYQPLGQCHMFKNLGNGHFADVTAQSGLMGVTGGLNIMQTDYNNDGWPDIYIVRGAWLGELGLLPDSLLRNNGDGTFADVTEEAGLLSFHPALSAVWFDANNDGWVDLFVGNETKPGGPPHPCQLFLNNGNGTFTECADAAGLTVVRFVRGVTAGDYDNDGYPDIYISCLNDDNILLHNDGKKAASGKPGVHFTDVTARTGVREPRLSFPTWFWDYDNDGWLDIFVCGFGADASAYYTVNGSHVTLGGIVADKMGRPNTIEKPRLYHNERNGLFTDATHAARLDRALLAMSGNFGDLDNDARLHSGVLCRTRCFIIAMAKRSRTSPPPAVLGICKKDMRSRLPI
jgi:hypothetical protein